MRGARSVVAALTLTLLAAASPAAQTTPQPTAGSAPADRLAHAEEQRLLGVRQYDAARYPESRQLLEAALATFTAEGDRAKAALTRRALGSTLLLMGDRPAAEALYREALAEFRALGMRAEEGRSLLSLSYATDGDDVPEAALAIGRELGDLSMQARALHILGDARFTAGNFDAARAALQESVALYEADGERREVARVLTSLGRLHRAHGRPADALAFYEKAVVLQNASGDEQGVIQSLNAMAIAYDATGRRAESLQRYEQALARARQTGSKAVLAFILGNTGSAYIAAGRRDAGIAMLREAIDTQPDAANAQYWHLALAGALLDAGDVAGARTHADRAVALTRSRNTIQQLPHALNGLARVRERQGDVDGALAALREALDVIETQRRTLVPTDFMKRGFLNVHKSAYDRTVHLLAASGRGAEAFDAAEQARARAFLDLLAGRDSAAFAPVAGVTAADPGLRSASMTTPASAQEMLDLAKRLGSTVLAYWVSERETIIWAIAPSGIHVARTAVDATRLRRLVNATGVVDVEGTRGAGAARADRAGVAPPRITAPPRGPWRELYRLLVAPVAAHLPRQAGARVTIIPHDALLGLSFAALEDARGRYLVEQYAVHYVPAGGLLRFTADRDRALASVAPRYLVVANPSPFPASAEPLPPLPGAAQEARDIARLAPPGAAVTLDGGAATERAVRSALAGASVVHFATHALVHDEAPMDSFLALAATDGGAADADGRLTVRELYDVRLDARLVVLSACRTAAGEVTGDGILGLSRAFFFAGAPAILATTWDVADGPTRRLVERFYSRWPSQSRGDALRDAQLELIRDLRAGRITVPTAAGKAVLPEHPQFWAGFVLLGEF